MTPPEMMPGTMSQDILSLAAAFGLIYCLSAIRRGSGKAWLWWLGLTGYLLYAYGLYAFERLYNGFFLLYIGIFSCCIYSVILFFRSADLRIFKETLNRRAPRTGTAVYLLVLVMIFTLVWMRMILPAIKSHVPPNGSSIFVMDLAFFLPLLTIAAVQLLKRRPLGDFLAPVLLIKMGVLGLSVFLGGLLAPHYGQPLDWPMLGLFALLGVGGAVLALHFLRRLGPLSS